MRALSTALSCVLSLQLALPPVFAQSPPTQLEIVVLEGEGAIYHIGQKATQNTVVRVQDEAQKPVAGASVVFSLPTDGASGEFSNGSKTLIVTTDARGEAAANNVKVNRLPGKLQIHVNASYKGVTGRANITQFVMNVPGAANSGGGGGSSKTLLIILAVAGAAAGGGIYAATRGGSSTSASPSTPTLTPIGITPGAATVGPPR